MASAWATDMHRDDSETTSHPSPGQESAESSRPDIMAEFLARKQAAIQIIVDRFPVLPRLIAICLAYCAMACVCLASLVVLFVGSFVLTGHDRVVARLRWLFELVRARRDQGLTGRGLALVWWLIRLAGDLVTAAAARAAGGASSSSSSDNSSNSRPGQQRSNSGGSSRPGSPRGGQSGRNRSSTAGHSARSGTRRERPRSSTGPSAQQSHTSSSRRSAQTM